MKIAAAIFSIGVISVVFSTAGNASTEQLAESISQAKSEIAKAEETSRDVMSTLYEINQRMKAVSKRRDILNNRLLSVQGNVQTLTVSKTELEVKIALQRRLLSKRLRAMYMLGDQPVVRTLFSSTSAQDLEKSLKYLRLIAVQDYHLIKSFEHNLKALKVRKTKLDKEMAKLANLKTSIRSQEETLEKDQSSKKTILVQLRGNHEMAMKKWNGLRRQAAEQRLTELVDTTFYENKGKIASPVNAPLIKPYGLVENEEFRYRLAHKGHSYNTTTGDPVRAVFGGKIAYVGQIAGYGTTVIVDHSDHFYTVYSQNSTALVNQGTSVKQGDLIAKSGDALYFEIRHFSDAVDPEQWLTSKERHQ